MIRLGVAGHPVAHSLSPVIHQAAIDALGLDARYERWDVPPDAFDGFVARALREGVHGMNITVPLKTRAAAIATHRSALVAAIGAANTLTLRDTVIQADNTDAAGFLDALRDDFGFDPAGKQCVVAGAGGSAAAVVWALLDGGARVTLANRTLSRGQALAQRLADSGPVTVIGLPEAATAAQDASLVVNCTSVGMQGGPDPGGMPLALPVDTRAIVIDLVYAPAITPLLALAAARGLPHANGLSMLVHQAARSFRIWFERPAPVEVMRRAAGEALAGR